MLSKLNHNDSSPCSTMWTEKRERCCMHLYMTQQHSQKDTAAERQNNYIAEAVANKPIQYNE